MNVVQLIQPDEQISFDDFWLVYPRREAKKDALKAWNKLTDSNQMAALIALVGWRKVFMARESVNYIPLAASWLNGERWEDELPADFRQVTHAQKEDDAFRERQAESKGKGVPMPDQLRQLLATLKKGRT